MEREKPPFKKFLGIFPKGSKRFFIAGAVSALVLAAIL